MFYLNTSHKKPCLMNHRNRGKKGKKVSLTQDLVLLRILETSSNLATHPLGYFLEAELSKTENVFVALLWAWRKGMNYWSIKYVPTVTSFFMWIFKDYFNIFRHYFPTKIIQSSWNHDQNSACSSLELVLFVFVFVFVYFFYGL